MELGFDTIGNATLIVYDNGPLLVTDPWLGGDAYFGSWALSHEVPEEQLDAAMASRFVWFSHGHPDHLNGAWLKQFPDAEVLLPDHIGGRIKADLERAGLQVRVLPHATWVPLSDRVRVWCFADVNQDAVLLVDVDGRLLMNINDATQTGWGPAVRRETRRFKMSVLLQLSGYGDADMINFVDEAGVCLDPLPLIRKRSGYRVGDALAKTADGLGATHVVPFSSMHRYQREDSAWANKFAVADTDYLDGFNSVRARLLTPFVRYDARANDWCSLDPKVRPHAIVPSREFGDDWSETLTATEVIEVENYLRRVEYLTHSIGFVGFRVGGREHVIRFDGRDTTAGVTFEVPRGSLMKAVRYQIFDDLLIGNFMKTTLHGKWPPRGLSSRFGRHVTRFADNGRAFSRDEVAEYLRIYRERTLPIDRIRFALEGHGARLVRSSFRVDSAPYRAARRAYWNVKKFTR